MTSTDILFRILSTVEPPQRSFQLSKSIRRKVEPNVDLASASFPALNIGCLFCCAWHLLHVLPNLGTHGLFSRAGHRWCVDFPALDTCCTFCPTWTPLDYFPALGTGGLHIFPRLTQVSCLRFRVCPTLPSSPSFFLARPALAVWPHQLRAWNRLRSDWIFALL